VFGDRDDLGELVLEQDVLAERRRAALECERPVRDLPAVSGLADERSSITVKRAPSSAITTMRQKSGPPLDVTCT